jgi:aspartate-semialdehyde dehydrogenase
MKKINLGIVGATGLVGETFLKLLDEHQTPVGELRLFASEQSLGKKIPFRNTEMAVQVLAPHCFRGLDVVFFSSGDNISLEWAPKAVADGAFAIDNSAAFRMDPQTALVVPEINFHHIVNPSKPQVIANPNCSTIQMVLPLEALKPLELVSVRVASYQSVSGAGKEAIEDLRVQSQAILDGQTPQPGKNFIRPIGFDCHPIIGSLDEDGFCSEENKIVAETKKILSLPQLKVSAFTVRVPTLNSHAEAVWVETNKSATENEIYSLLKSFKGLSVIENKKDFSSLSTVTNKDDVFVSRLKKVRDFANTWQMWVVADNIRRGAATNGLLIAQKLFQ